MLRRRRRLTAYRESIPASRALRGSVVILSPHLDDAVLSLGAAIAVASWAGARLRVVTVLAGDPESAAPAGAWDLTCGYATEGDAARDRRREDVEACAAVGAEPVWLPFRDMEYASSAPGSEVAAAVGETCRDADVVLLPGHPLTQPDHAWLARLVLDDLPDASIGLYVEQPYAALAALSRGGRVWASGASARGSAVNAARMLVDPETVRPRRDDAAPVEEREWFAVAATARARRAKRRAVRCYRSQVAAFGPLVLQRIAYYERAWGGEGLAWLRR